MNITPELQHALIAEGWTPPPTKGYDNLVEAKEMLDYFWRQKEDISRWCGFDRHKMQVSFPGVLKAWDAYLSAGKAMDAAVEAGT